MIQANQVQLDDNATRVLKALTDPRWDFRTIEGIVKETDMSAEAVAESIDALTSIGKVRESAVPDNRGRSLYTLKARPVSARESLAEVRNFFG